MSDVTGLWAWRMKVQQTDTDPDIDRTVGELIGIMGKKLVLPLMDGRTYAVQFPGIQRLDDDDNGVALVANMWVFILFAEEALIDDIVIPQHPGFPEWRGVEGGTMYLAPDGREYIAVHYGDQMIGWRRIK